MENYPVFIGLVLTCWFALWGVPLLWEMENQLSFGVKGISSIVIVPIVWFILDRAER